MNNKSYPICLCQRPLREYAVDPGDICINCVRELSPNEDKSEYICLNDGCFFDQIANQCYLICAQCYNPSNAIHGNDNMDRVEFICNKIKSSIDTISYVFYFIFILFITTWPSSFIIPLNRETYHGNSWYKWEKEIYLENISTN